MATPAASIADAPRTDFLMDVRKFARGRQTN
jgi:hypothetical protein